MSDSIATLPQIKKLIITGLIWQYVPFFMLVLLESLIENKVNLEAISALFFLLALMSFILGYFFCGNAIGKYAHYKGYKNYFWIYSFLNIIGLSILFLLDNKKISKNIEQNCNPLLNFSILSIFLSWIAIPVALMPFAYSIALLINGTNEFKEYISNPEFLAICNVVGQTLIIAYLFRKLNKSNVDYKNILGSINRINYKLLIILTIAQYFFNSAINSITLYGLSFIIPQYVENHINYRHATTIVGYIAFAIGATIFAPILEEFLFRGIIFQKLALTKGIVKAMVISAIAFTIIHFRFDLLPLFIFGILYVILYFKTKQLAVPILAHFFYNATVLSKSIYTHFFSDIDLSIHTTIAEYQQHFIEHWQWDILYIALSAPYLCYFIYKNFPRSSDINKLPYFVNQQVSEYRAID